MCCFNAFTLILQSNNSFLLLQGDDKLYINHGDVLQNIYPAHKASYDSATDGEVSYSGKTDEFRKGLILFRSI